MLTVHSVKLSTKSVRHTFEKVVTSFAYRYFLEVEGRDLTFINHEIDLPDRLHKWFLDVKVTLFFR
uniref:Uncharacterized protein n=1 Tax=Rhizophagus irregularis (strain DAOM 181602 / DAOM 197198 / MUCL 43194) TaxID=747089 RepID=U9UVI1_RHIID